MNSDLEQLKELYDIMLDKNLDALEIKDEDSRIKLTRRMVGVPVSTIYHPSAVSQAAPRPLDSPGAVSSEAEAPEAPSILTPLAGLFYRASSPTSVPFVRENDVVDPGQTLCIVEAMKVMNEIKAEARCKILKIAVENGRPVSSGQVLFFIEPA